MTKQLYNHEAEEKLIAIALVDPQQIQTLAIEPDAFYLERNQLIWAAVQDKLRAGEQIDFVTVCDELEKRGKLGAVGGVTGLSRYADDPVYLYKSDELAGIVRQYSRRRQLVQLASEIAKEAHNTGSDLDALSVRVIDALTKLSETQRGAIQWGGYFDDLLLEIAERMKDPKDVWGIPTGFIDFDKITGGFQLGESVILSGSPGVGKSILAMQMASQMSQSAPGAIYSLEMTGRAVARRITSGEANIETRKMKKGTISAQDMRAIEKAAQDLSNRPVYMSDAETWTTAGLRADLTRLKALHGIQWFVVDYLYLMGDGGENEIEKTAIISKGLKQVAKALNLAGLAIHSMNKEGMDRAIPGQTALRGSGQVQYDADLIIFLKEFIAMSQDDKFIQDDEAQNLRTLIFGKGRELETPQNYLHLVKRPYYPAFGDYRPDSR